MNELETQAELQALRQEVRRLDLMNEALVDAGKKVVDERDALRARCERYERILYPQTHEQADLLQGRTGDHDADST